MSRTVKIIALVFLVPITIIGILAACLLFFHDSGLAAVKILIPSAVGLAKSIELIQSLNKDGTPE